MTTFVRITQDDYIRYLRSQKDPNKRDAMKRYAHAAMYGQDPEAEVVLPLCLIPVSETNERPSWRRL